MRFYLLTHKTIKQLLNNCPEQESVVNDQHIGNEDDTAEVMLDYCITSKKYQLIA